MGLTFSIIRIMLSSLEGRVVAVLPDFFIDRIVKVGSWAELSSKVVRKKESLGGSIHGVEQIEVKGGNAVNLACSLASLGVRTRLLAISCEPFNAILKEAIKDYNSLELRIKNGRPGLTIALELFEGNTPSRIMLSDVGSLAEFGPEMLDDEDMKWVKGSSLIAIVNYASNRRCSRLANALFTMAKESGRLTFMDPADISSRSEEFAKFLLECSKAELLDILSLNEVEAYALSSSLGLRLGANTLSKEGLKAMAWFMGEKLGIKVDIHSPIGSTSYVNGELFFKEAYPVEPKVLTGSGDVWDAGDIIGHLANLSNDGRLILANAMAYLYLKSPIARSPSIEELEAFLDDANPTGALW